MIHTIKSVASTCFVIHKCITIRIHRCLGTPRLTTCAVWTHTRTLFCALLTAIYMATSSTVIYWFWHSTENNCVHILINICHIFNKFNFLSIQTSLKNVNELIYYVKSKIFINQLINWLIIELKISSMILHMIYYNNISLSSFNKKIF